MPDGYRLREYEPADFPGIAALWAETGMPIKLEVHRENAKAIGLYRRAGFVRLGDYDVYIVRDVAAIKADRG
jgi:hypothetical protein